jgi:hypothetical protein
LNAADFSLQQICGEVIKQTIDLIDQDEYARGAPGADSRIVATQAGKNLSPEVLFWFRRLTSGFGVLSWFGGGVRLPCVDGRGGGLGPWAPSLMKPAGEGGGAGAAATE